MTNPTNCLKSRTHARASTALACWLVAVANAPSVADAADPTNLTVSYVAYQFEAGEGWHTIASGDAGATRLDGRMWHYDFTRGASSIGLALPDRSLLTRPQRFRLRVRGEAKGHPVSVSFRTHFMTFQKVVGEFTGSGEQQLVFAAPPGEGWQWRGGENDGKIHGPFRLGDIQLEANGLTNSGVLELVSFTVEGQCPGDKLCAMTADYVATAGKGEFRVELRALATSTLAGTLNWTVRDWDQHELKRGQQPVVLPAGGERMAVSVPLPECPQSLRFAEASFSLDIPGQVVSPVQAYWLAPVPPRAEVGLQPESPFGMGVYLCRYGGRDQEDVARRARDAGVKWSREDFSWQRIEPQPGEFHWDYYDTLLDTARRNGITVYAIVGYWTSWSKNYTSEGVDQYVAFLRQLVRRYKDRIKQWEIWNEPNIFFWQGPKELYAEMLKKSYAAVKAEDPSAQVLGISTAGIDSGFIDKMLKLGTPFDVLTIHPYRKTLDDAAFVADLKKASDQVMLADGTRRPVWLTEMGWATQVPHHVLRQDFEPVTQRTQAELIARTYLCSIVSGVEPRTFWYDFRNDGDDPFYFEHTLGTLRHDGKPKPAYLAYATLAAVLDGMKYEQPIEAGAGNFVHRFVSTRGDGRVVMALWNPKSDATVDLRLPVARVQLVNTVGETKEMETQPPSGGSPTRLLSVPLKAGSPAYVVMDGKLSLHLPAEKPEVFERVEISVSNVPAANNPFDPGSIALDLEVIQPSGKRLRVPGYFQQGFDRKLEGSREVLTPGGEGSWRIRWLPLEAGRHTLAATATLAGKPAARGETTIEVAAGKRHGLVRIEPDGKRYFRLDDGTPLFLNGLCACWHGRRGTYDYDDWLAACQKAGINYIRIWMWHQAFGIEWDKGDKLHYRLDNAWRLDHVLAEAEQQGVFVMLCLDYHGIFEVKPDYWGGNNFWPRHPYNAANGGPCQTQNDFFTNEEAKNLYAKRLRYLVARWSAFPNLLAWEFFNEIDNEYPYLKHNDVVAWHREMGQYLRSIDPCRHLISSSFTGGSERPDLFALPEIDFAQYHSYNEKHPAKMMAEKTAKFFEQYQKPFFVSEYGTDWKGWKPDTDPYFRALHQAIWSGAFTGAAGTGMTWWWESIHAANLYHHWSALSSFLEGTGMGRANLRPARFEIVEGSVTPFGVAAPDEAIVWLLDRAYDWPDGAMEANPSPVAGAKVTLTGISDGAWSVEWWDTLAGKRLATGESIASDGALRLAPPAFQVDIAARLKKR